MKKATNQPAKKHVPALNSFPIVGIGASAGGLEAVTLLLKHLPSDTGMGFVVVQHLDPVHKSALPDILSRATTMPVRVVIPNLVVEPNQVYVIPPNKNLSIERGVLKLPPRSKASTRQRAIDFFFEALACDQSERAIGVILSGTASDGTLGLEAIKAGNGITFAQDKSAAYDGMPRNAVAAGCVDFVLSPEGIAKELARVATHPSLALKARRVVPDSNKTGQTGDQSSSNPTQEEGWKKVLQLLRLHSGVDFSLYKFSTIDRRINRRMVLNKKNTLAEYANYLRGNDKEMAALYSDVLISVTSFFRDPEAFDMLKRKVFAKLLPRPQEESFRAWVVGCSTGQEAYSIAMAFMECADQAPGGPNLQIFASDLSEANLEKARAGFYPKSIVQDIPPERLRRFFVEEKGGYRINKTLRELCVFARQNLASDPPFSRMDLVSCRNVLIYLDVESQKKALPIYHYALKPEGFLFLGASESIGTFSNLFETVDKKYKLFAKKPVPTPALRLAFARYQSGTPKEPPVARPAERGPRPELNAQREADRVMLNRFAPVGVLIDEELQILQFRGDTSAYLKPPVGSPVLGVVKMAREGLAQPLRTAVNQAKKKNTVVRAENIRVHQNGRFRSIRLEVIPLKNLKERSFLILFQEVKKASSENPSVSVHLRLDRSGEKDSRASNSEKASRFNELEQELEEAHDSAQAHQEQHEAANDELQAQSEELQSANEELQSINEELETSKEELESTNEELITVNDEMSNRNSELNRLISDLKNLHVSLHTGVVLLSRDLTIRNFTPLAERVFKFTTADEGRPLSHIKHNLVFPELESFIAEAIDTVSAREREVQDQEGQWYSLRVRPYLTLDNKIDGAVLMLVDINQIKQHEQALKKAHDYGQAILRTTRYPLVVLTPELRINTANSAFYQTFKVSAGETEGQLLFELGNGQWNIPKLRELLKDTLQAGSYFEDFEITHDFPGIGRRTMLLNARSFDVAEISSASAILLGIDDITDTQQSKALRAAKEELQRRAENLEQVVAERTATLQETISQLEVFSSSVAHDLRAPLRAMKGFADLLMDDCGEKIGASGRNYIHRIVNSADRMDKLTRDILDYSRVVRSPITLVPVDVRKLISEILEIHVNLQSPHSNISLKGEFPKVMAHEAMLTQCVANLLGNAAKFVAKGVIPKIQVWAERRDARIRFYFQDNGVGIEKHQHAKIFEIFSQLNTDYEGTGIGLAIVKKAMERMGGVIGLESEPGKGSVFWLELVPAKDNHK